MRIVDPEEAARRMYAYAACKSDGEAAVMLDMNEQTFRKWRTANGLRAKGKQGAKGKELPRTKFRVDLEGVRKFLPRA